MERYHSSQFYFDRICILMNLYFWLNCRPISAFQFSQEIFRFEDDSCFIPFNADTRNGDFFFPKKSDFFSCILVIPLRKMACNQASPFH